MTQEISGNIFNMDRLSPVIETSSKDTNGKLQQELISAIYKAQDIVSKLKRPHLQSPVDSPEFSKEIERQLDNEQRHPSSVKKNKYLSELEPLNTPKTSSTAFVDSLELHDTNVPVSNVINVINSLVDSLSKSMNELKDLKYKNLILNTNNSGTYSRYEIEKNLQKKEYERLKYQLLEEKQSYMIQLRAKDHKVNKYKKRIVEKNRAINKLNRILHENLLKENLKSNSLKSLNRNELERATPLDMKIGINASRAASGMLDTLGLLATHVLNDELIDEKNNETTIQSEDSVPNEGTQFGGSVASKAEISVKPFQMPKLRSFNTVNGSISDAQ
ncbi:Fdo1p NDAI_0H03000 [Naumovozyma dairenensis CBS 421]|uniref:Uncharacterized protein n=1 Tax=Naumovozyma dairenensis (strain ATCC 10597 / BCRC 20456 / CBS 421 / NBRC 0211 / NRRL Y-12639) TaxID=1071378 RepID=G0WFB2_NAUDC|nr:hypothetical protein NDAI_0H03000 [Naumovozyma dairenensis CBS 421]CCD26473.1 hypothetical protein NDAI_0H03000 [Naumovozyma dairenensis CBS 421]